MKDKMAAARAKGRGGWEQCDPATLSDMLRKHVEKGDPRDVANFCMMLWHLNAPISRAAESTSEVALGILKASHDGSFSFVPGPHNPVIPYEGMSVYASPLTREAATVPTEFVAIKEQVDAGAGFWRPCTGCYDTEDGHPTQRYQSSVHLGCDLGNGCSECGGLGAVWNDFSLYPPDEADPASPAAESKTLPRESEGACAHDYVRSDRVCTECGDVQPTAPSPGLAKGESE